MPQRPLQPCAHVGCRALIRGTYCPAHEKAVIYQRNKHYDKASRNEQATMFYQSSAWKRARQAALQRDDYLCQDCLKRERITPAEMVHHIRPIEHHPDLALTIDNLESLCNACHNSKTDRTP